MADAPESRLIDLATGDLVALVQDGYLDAYAEILRRYQSDVAAIVHAMLFERRDADELVQDVFVRAYKALESFDKRRDFGPWIRTITRNAVREYLRRRGRYSRRLEAYRSMLETCWADDDSDDDGAETKEALARCVRKLPDRARAALEMRYTQGRSFDSMAPDMGTTAGALRNLLCRVRSQLRRCLRREGVAL